MATILMKKEKKEEKKEKEKMKKERVIYMQNAPAGPG